MKDDSAVITQKDVLVWQSVNGQEFLCYYFHSVFSLVYCIPFAGKSMAIRYRCVHCNIVLSGEGASRHYLANPTHKLEKLPPPVKPVKSIR
jgi:hypothetical protein